MTASQLLVWTALPTSRTATELKLSVFLAPQLTATVPAGDSFAPLSLFPDFVDWPGSISSAPGGPVTFTVTFEIDGGPVTVPATNVTPAPPTGVSAGAAWQAIFDPSQTQVEPFTFTDYSTRKVYSFPVDKIAAFVGSIYGTIGTVSPTDPIQIAAQLEGSDEGNGQFSVPHGRTPTQQQVIEQQVYEALFDLAPIPQRSPARPQSSSGLIATPTAAFDDVRTFHAAPISPITTPPYPITPYPTPTTPTLDFHQALTGFNNFPAILRLFSLVFDLTVPIPTGLSTGSTQLLVTPTWTSSLGSSSRDVTPWTATTLSPTAFMPTPQGPDYLNGMLGLNDSTRFSVTDLDTDLAADRLDSLSTALQTGQIAEYEQADSSYTDEAPASVAVTVPALRSAGPQVIWTGYATSAFAGFAGLLDGQKTLQTSLEGWISSSTDANLPVIYAEQLIRGNRFDVYTASEASPTWRSLCGRRGQYTFGPNESAPISFENVDEGLVSPGASQKVAPSTGSDPLIRLPELYVHESIARWAGWGLCAQRPGKQIDRYTNTTDPNPQNMPPAPSATGPSAPQLAAYFVPPSPTHGPEYLFPKLRYGSTYQIRARGVDLAGNSLPVTSTDASTATAPFVHYRYEPVLPPVLAGMAPFTPGESTLFLVLLDDQVTTPGTNGRWLFPPRVSELMAEEHGMFDGFSLGGPPNPADGPSGSAATYSLIADYDATNLGDVTTTPGNFEAPLIGTYDFGNQGVPYFTGTPQPWTPWLSDPLGAGPALSGLPGVAAGSALTGAWSGVWPAADPLLITLGTGTTPTSSYVAPTGGAPGTFEVALPPAEVGLVRISSALTPGALGMLGVWPWFDASPTSGLAASALQGQVWLLSPFQVLRMVHAVRLPLVAPSFGSPEASRIAGSVSVDLDDPDFLVDAKSTSHIDVNATWTDPYDNPSDPTSDPGEPPPGTPKKRSTITSGGPAFRLTIPDPNPTGPEAQPLTIVQPPQTFAFTPNEDGETHEESSTHHVGDTLHHLVYYTATGTSRFADLFQSTESTTLTVGTAAVVGSAALGLSAPTVQVTIVGPGGSTPVAVGTVQSVAAGSFVILTADDLSVTVDVTGSTSYFSPVTTSPPFSSASVGDNVAVFGTEASGTVSATTVALVEVLQYLVDFTVDESAATVTVLATAARVAGTTYATEITYQPTVTVPGQARAVEVLSTARPLAPRILQVVPAWQLQGPSGSIGSEDGISFDRTGGFLRVYLDRPWFTSGGGELLGVVTTVTDPSDATSTFPTTPQEAWVTMMGLDPINYAVAPNVEELSTPWPVVPTDFINLAPVPDVPYRPVYSNPPQVNLAEDDENLYQVWPYEVAYDSVGKRWYVDVAPQPGTTPDGTFTPPPGYFIRLALARFQPYSIDGVEVSEVVTTTFTQPVPDRSVSVVANTGDKTGMSVYVTVFGPGYQGWRPPLAPTLVTTNADGSTTDAIYDGNNAYAPQNPDIYGSNLENTEGSPHTSTMVVEVQVQSEVLNKLGIEGDLAWESTSTGPVLLPPDIGIFGGAAPGAVWVAWGGGDGSGSIGLVELPEPVTATIKMRLRISELDYYTESTAPTTVDTTFRRPFVAFIPLN